MDFVKILMLVNLLAYSILVGQAYMYIIALTNVQNNLDAPSYIRFRQLTDKNFMAKYKWVVYTVLITSILLSIFTADQPGSVRFISAAIALLALIIDTALTMKGNLPINKLINGWTTDNYPADWQTWRAKWMRIYSMRQVATIAGFISLLVGAVFGS